MKRIVSFLLISVAVATAALAFAGQQTAGGACDEVKSCCTGCCAKN